MEESILGVFGIGEDNEIVEKTLYQPDPKEIAEALSKQLNGELTREVDETIEKLVKRGFKKLIFTNRALANSIRNRRGVDVEVVARSDTGEYLRANIEALAMKFGFVKEIPQLYKINKEVSVLMSQRGIGKSLSERESITIQSVQLLNELDKSLNSLSGKLRDWYGLHFPEMSRLVEDHWTYALIVKTFGNRADIDETEASKISPRAEDISKAIHSSIGALLSQEDLEPIRELASNLDSLYMYRKNLEAYIESVTRERTPNLSEVAGPILAARLIEKAGGLKKLALMPSSTIQLLGAEKAMFRAMKSRSRPPKHGLIFQHPIVHSASRSVRGKAARSLAAKLAIAARADYFSGSSLGARLRSELNTKMAEIYRVHKG